MYTPKPATFYGCVRRAMAASDGADLRSRRSRITTLRCKHHLAALGIAEADDRLHEGLAQIRTTPAHGLTPGCFGIYRLSR